ncbi:outer membrane lipoprotein Blc [compost metagenome]
MTSYNHDYLWILSRSPQPPKAKVDALIAKARGLGFATDQLIWVSQEPAGNTP